MAKRNTVHKRNQMIKVNEIKKNNKMNNKNSLFVSLSVSLVTLMCLAIVCVTW